MLAHTGVVLTLVPAFFLSCQMSIGTIRRQCDSRGFVTNIGAGAKEGIVGGISAGMEG